MENRLGWYISDEENTHAERIVHLNGGSEIPPCTTGMHRKAPCSHSSPGENPRAEHSHKARSCS